MDAIAAAIARRQRLHVVHANAHLVNLAQTRPWLIELFDQAGIAFCDGAGVQLATWLRTGHRPSRHTPPQWIDPLARRLAATGATVFWLGGRPEAVEAAARRIEATTGLRGAGHHHGYFDKAPGSAENEAVLAAINQAAPDLLLINMGMPQQERWLFDNRDRLQVPVAITAGALVDHAAGLVSRPPGWVTDAGLEWLVRLVLEPRRLWRRYVLGLPVFALRLAWDWAHATMRKAMPQPDVVHLDPQLPSSTLWSTRLLGVRVDDIAPAALMDAIAAAIARRQRLHVVNANAHLVNLAQTRPWLIELFDQAGIAFCDGAGVQLATWLRTGHRPSRHTPPQWIDPLARRLAATGATVFWLGGRPEAVEAAARRIEATTGLRGAGHHHGYFDKAPGSAENEAVLAAINQAAPDLLLINMGMPQQERWLFDNRDRLQVPVAITAGALVDHAAGLVSRPPGWVTDAGLEWLVRLVLEPRRLWRRYVLGLPVFALRLAWDWAKILARKVVPDRKAKIEQDHAIGCDR